MAYVPKNVYRKIQNSLTPAERELVNFYELQWHLRHTVPSVEEVTQHLRKKYDKIRYTSVNYYLNRQPVKKALTDRGIPYQQSMRDELTPTQVAAAVTAMNTIDKRELADRLDQMGISASQYYAWQNDPKFRDLLHNLSEQNLTNIRPQAITEFTKKINQGDWNAIKFYLETTGELKSDSVPATETMLKMIVEVIQEEVKDGDTILRIAERLKNVFQNKTLEVVDERKAITGEVIEYDPELEHAKKQLGFG